MYAVWWACLRKNGSVVNEEQKNKKLSLLFYKSIQANVKTLVGVRRGVPSSILLPVPVAREGT